MSRTLNLVDRQMSLARHFHQLGLLYQAARVLQRLANFQELPAEIAEEINRRLGEIHLQRRKFKNARRHLAAALSYQPENAQYHFLLASAVRQDPRCNPERAAQYYQRALELDPDHADHLAEFGLYQLEQGRREEGLATLQKAFHLDPDNPHLVQKVGEAFRAEEEFEAARSMLRLSFFRNPKNPRFKQLWEKHLFAQAKADLDEEAAGPEKGPRFLPFTRPVESRPLSGPIGKIIRRDPPALPTGPHQPRNVPGRRA